MSLKRRLEQDSAGAGVRRQRSRVASPTPASNQWHPRYGPDSIKVVFISNDGKKFSVDRGCLVGMSMVFRDAFSIPTSGDDQGTRDNPVDIDETADDLTVFFDSLGVAPCRPAPKIPEDLEGLATLLRIARKYDAATVLARIEGRLQTLITTQPYKALAFASTQGDIELGRRAIRVIRFKNLSVGGGDIWQLIAGLTPAWQIAFARLVMPKLSRESHGLGGIKVTCNVDMGDVARRFVPDGV